MFDIESYLAAEDARRWALLEHDLTTMPRRPDETVAKARLTRMTRRHRAAVAAEMSKFPQFRRLPAPLPSYDEILAQVRADRSLATYRAIHDEHMTRTTQWLIQGAMDRQIALEGIDAAMAAAFDAEAERRVYGFGADAVGWRLFWAVKRRQREGNR